MTQREIVRQGQVPPRTIGAKRAFELDMRGEHWYDNPVGLSKLQRVVARKGNRIVLNEIEYAVSYGHEFPSKLTGERNPCIRLKRTDGELAPFGYISIAKIERFRFEEDE